MPATYNGVTTGLPVNPVAITIPVDGDTLSAASANTALEKLADWTQFFNVNALRGAGYINQATGTNPGIIAKGAVGPSGGAGAEFTGGGLNPGVRAIGSPGGSAGAEFTGTTNKTGVIATGGPTDGTGGEFFGGGTNGPGVTARGLGTGRGGHFTAESSLAGEFSRDDAGTDSLLETLRIANGYVLLGGDAPAYNVALPSRALHQAKLVKGFGILAWSNGAPTIDTARSINLASVASPSTGRIDVTLATAPAQYFVLPISSTAFDARVNPVATPGSIYVYAPGTTTLVDFNSTSGYVVFAVLGLD